MPFSARKKTAALAASVIALASAPVVVKCRSVSTEETRTKARQKAVAQIGRTLFRSGLWGRSFERFAIPLVASSAELAQQKKAAEAAAANEEAGAVPLLLSDFCPSFRLR